MNPSLVFAMKPSSSRWRTVCWALLPLWGSWLGTLAAAAPPEPIRPWTCGFPVRMDVLTVSTSWAIVGFPSLLPDPQNPTVYLERFTSNGCFWNWAVQLTNTQTHASSFTIAGQTNTRCETWQYTAAFVTLPTNTARAGLIATRTNHNNTNIVQCSSVRSQPPAADAWSNGDCHFGYEAPGTNVTLVASNLSGAELVVVTGESWPYVWADGPNIQTHFYSVTNATCIRQLSPCSLATFQSNVTLPTTWPDWTNATSRGFACRGGQNAYRQLSEESAQLSLTLSRLKYRIAFMGPRRHNGTIKWIERFTPAMGGPVLNSNFEQDVVFDGGVQYLEVTGGLDGKVVSYPGLAGQLEVFLDPETQWGCPDGACSRPGLVELFSDAVNFRINLGQNDLGEPAGFLFVNQEDFSTNLATPTALQVFGSHGVAVLRDASQVIQQVKTPHTLAVVETNGPRSYMVKFYPGVSGTNANGLYIPAGSIFSSCSISSPATSQQVDLVEVAAGHTSSSFYQRKETAYTWGWLLNRCGVRSEQQIQVWANDGTFYYITNLHVFHEVEWPSLPNRPGPTNFLAVEVLRTPMSPSDRRCDLLERRVGTTVAPQVTRWTYYDDPQDASSFGKVRSVVQPSGYWEQYEYTNRLLSRVLRQYLDSSRTDEDPTHHRSTLFSYTPVAGSGDDGSIQTNLPRTTIESVGTNEVGRTYQLVHSGETIEIRRLAPGTGWTTNDLFTTNSLVAVPDYDGVLERTVRPDGSVALHAQGTIRPGAYVTNILATGAPGSDLACLSAGTQVTTIVRPDGRPAERQTYDVLSGALLADDLFDYQDSSPTVTTLTIHSLDGTSTSQTTACCGLQAETDADGLTTTYTYDGLHRLSTQTRAGLTLSNVYDAADRPVATYRYAAGLAPALLNAAQFDWAGEQTSATDSLGISILYARNSNGTVRTTYFPNSGEATESYAQDGTLLLRTGSGVRPVRYTNWIETDGTIHGFVSREILLDANTNETAQWTSTYHDMLGRPYRTVFASPSAAISRSLYNARGQLAQAVDPDGVATTYLYNSLGEPVGTAVGTDRLTILTNDVIENLDGFRVRRTRSLSWVAANLWITNFTIETAVTAERTWTWEAGQPTKTLVERLGNGQHRTTLTAPDRSSLVSFYSQGRLSRTTWLDTNGVQVGRADYTYDGYGRQTGLLDARTGLTTNSFDNHDRLRSVTTPAPRPGQAQQTTSAYYDRMGSLTNVTFPDGVGFTNLLSPAGDLLRRTGARTYPAGYAYDPHGRLLAMTTWTNYPSTNGLRVTSNALDPQRGWITAKRDASNRGVDYTYTPAGRLAQRAWARGGTPRVTTTYATNAQGELAGITYNDGTPSLTFAYDPLGRPRTVTQGNVTATFTWDHTGRLLSEAYSGGPLADLGVTNLYDSLGRRTGVGLLTQSTNLNRYAYDAASRTCLASNGLLSATYAYLSNSPLIAQTLLRHGGGDIIVCERAYDNLNRLSQQHLFTVNGAYLSFAYGYNLAGQRTNLALADGSFWDYRYDWLGQLTNAHRHWSDNAWVAGQQFAFAFDGLANRLQTWTGGDASGTGLRAASYLTDSVNQYLQRGVPRSNDLTGTAPALATVVVNGETNSNRHGDYFWKALGTTTTNASWLPVTVTASQGATNQTDTGHLFLPATPETFTHDLDGNLTSDGRWTNTWDAENRLLSMQTLPAAYSAGAPRQNILFTYDWQGRRIRKTVAHWISGDWSLVTDHRFIYDGWNLLAVLDQTNGLVQSFTWGLDASGTMQGAGGVGGLLAMTVHTGTNAGTYFYCYDGNWNVVGLVNATNGALAARYEYGPFHELIRATGPVAHENPFLAATKYYDWETGLYYYGFRYYSPSTGRWLSRDPLGEAGGRNLYGYTQNDPCRFFDPLGLEITYFYGDGRALFLPGPVPYLTGDAAWENLVAGAYNLLPILDNQLYGAASATLGLFNKGVEGGRELARWAALRVSGNEALAGFLSRWTDTYLSVVGGEFVLSRLARAKPALLSDSFARQPDGIRNSCRPSQGFGKPSDQAGGIPKLDDGIPLTGVSRFDELAIKARYFPRFLDLVRALGFRPRPYGGLTEARAQFRGNGLFVYNPNTMTVIDMLHEIKHIQQFRRAGFDPFYNPLTEVQAYNFERFLLREQSVNPAYLEYLEGMPK